jgi:hypothetical protein
MASSADALDKYIFLIMTNPYRGVLQKITAAFPL